MSNFFLAIPPQFRHAIDMSKKKKKPGAPVKTSNLAGMKKLLAIAPEETDQLRRGVFNLVKKNLPKAKEVLEGKRTWSNQQVKLYLSLMDKVMPTLTATKHDHTVKTSIDDLSVDDLKRLAQEEIDRMNAVPHQPSQPASSDPDYADLDSTIPQALNSPLLSRSKPKPIDVES